MDGFIRERLRFFSEAGPDHRANWMRNKSTLEFLGALQVPDRFEHVDNGNGNDDADADHNDDDYVMQTMPGFGRHEAASELLRFHCLFLILVLFWQFMSQLSCAAELTDHNE